MCVVCVVCVCVCVCVCACVPAACVYSISATVSSLFADASALAQASMASRSCVRVDPGRAVCVCV